MPEATSPSTTLRKRLLIILAISCISIGVIYLIYWMFQGRFLETTDDAYVGGNQVQVMSQISGKVVDILADETDYVSENETLLKLDDVDAQINLKEAEAQLALTVRQVSQLYNNVHEMESDVSVQQSKLQQTAQDLKRREGLVVNKTISEEELQHAKIAYDEAKHSLELSQHKLQAGIDLIANTDLYHHPQITQAAAKVRDTYIALQRTIIYAPESGYIAKRSVEIGQQVNPNTVLMVIVPLNQIWINANYKESQLKYFRIGQPVEIIADVYGGDVVYHGKVIGLSPGTGGTFDLLPPQNATGNWIKVVQRVPVRIAIDTALLHKYPLQLGLSVTTTIDTHDRQGKKLMAISQSRIVSETRSENADLQQAEALIKKIIETNAKNTSYTATP